MEKIIITEEQYKKLMALNEEFPPNVGAEEKEEPKEGLDPDGLTAGLVDGIITSFHVLNNMDASGEASQEAIKDLVSQDLVSKIADKIQDGDNEEPSAFGEPKEDSGEENAVAEPKKEKAPKKHDSAGSWSEPKTETPAEEPEEEKQSMFEGIETTFGSLEVRNLLLEGNEIKGEVKSSYGVWGKMKWDEQGVVKGIDNPFKKLTYKLPIK